MLGYLIDMDGVIYKIVESIADLDPFELEREFGAGTGALALAHLHPSHRPRRKTAAAGAF